MQIKLANPRGFCAGVDRAIEIVNRALQRFGPPVYVRHEVVHNRIVVEELRHRGAIFVDNLDEVPTGSLVIFSAHGVSHAVQKEAKQKKLQVFDATCPLVTKVHNEVKRFSRANVETILIGHAGHPEVEGTMGQFANPDKMHLVENQSDVAKLVIDNPEQVSFVTQTTLSIDDMTEVIDALRSRFPKINRPNKGDICYATQNRQDAVKELAFQCDLLIVVGSDNSSNSNRLRELGEKLGIPSYLIDDADQIQNDWFLNVNSVGLTSGASAPESLVEQVIARLNTIEDSEVVNVVTRQENIKFSIPKALR